jgi:hypothetical protein
LKNLEIFDRSSVQRTPFINASITELSGFAQLSTAFALRTTRRGARIACDARNERRGAEEIARKSEIDGFV